LDFQLNLQTAHPLLITPGEPGGIGAEITVKAWNTLRDTTQFSFAYLGNEDHVTSRAKLSGLSCKTRRIENLAQIGDCFPDALPILHRPLPAVVTVGQFSPTTAHWVTTCITEAVDLCLSGHASGIVTNPIQKEALYAAGFKHQGHTDFLAALCHERSLPAQEVMMLVGGGLRAVPITVHIALKDVPAALTQATIITQAEVVHHALQTRFGIPEPRIAITGLNPHSGENGAMGREEIEVIRPAIAAIQAKGINAFGPLPADTAFFPQARDSYDVILCMYHDQALIPVKTLDFHGGVNVTLGLPFIRTSPDHGTALNLAGTGKAQAESLIAAIRLAAEMAAHG
jgi:4-hydroxythreonine-4-phosphate dehydrogenase